METQIEKGAVLVTGASSGMGRACALRLDQTGYKVFAGIRKASDAEALKQVATSRLTPIFLDVTDQASFAVFEETTRDTLAALDTRFATFVQREVELIWQRGVLTPWERAYLSLAVDVLYQTLDDPFQFHVDLALKAGGSLEQIRSVLRFLQECSIVKVWEAFRALDRLLEERAGNLQPGHVQ